MKKILMLSVFVALGLCVSAQVSTLNETFDGFCPIPPQAMINWKLYTPISGMPGAMNWNCTETDGRNGTAGILCTGYYNNVNHLDTSYLFTPMLFFPISTEPVYIQFDTKTSYVGDYATFNILHTLDTIPTQGGLQSDSDLTSESLPQFGNGDESDWVTHQVNISGFMGENFYIAFRFTSLPTDIPSAWYLDNVNITHTPLGLNGPAGNNQKMLLSVIGNSTQEQIKLAYYSKRACAYDLSVYDMLGREVCKQQVNALAGNQAYTIGGLHLTSGLYIIKMENEVSSGRTKTMIK